MRSIPCLLALLAVSLAACGSSTPAPSPTGGATPTATAPALLPVPTDFGSACALERQVCPAADAYSGPFPDALRRPLHLPSLLPGQQCPVSSGSEVHTSQFAGYAMGSGPVRPLVGASRNAGGGLALEANPTAGWYAFKTLWFTDPSYSGPARIRGARIDAAGAVAFGEQPQIGELIIPPGPTLNQADGYREAPGGTWVRGPGCYAWQIDAVGYSAVLVFRADRH